MGRSHLPGVLFGILATAAFLAVSFPAAADEPQGVGWKFVQSAKSGAAKPGANAAPDDRLVVRLFAAHRELAKKSLLVVFPGCGDDPEVAGRPVRNLDEFIAGKAPSPLYFEEWQRPKPRWSICADDSFVLIRPGRSANLGIGVDFLRLASEGMSPRLEGKVYIVPSALLKQTREPRRLAALLNNEQPSSILIIDLYYRLIAEKKSWRKGTFAQIFTPALPENETGRPTGDYLSQAPLLPVVPMAYKRTVPLPGSFQDDGGALLKTTLVNIPRLGSGRAGDQICDQDPNFAPRPLLLGDSPALQVGPGAYAISGLFSTKWSTDHSLHPGWGFRVEAWSNDSGAWVLLASDWVQSNGTWTLGVNTPSFLGHTLRILYRSFNSYYAPQDRDGNKYSWVDPDWTEIPFTFGVGHRVADCDGGAYNGVGELVDAAMTMWSSLYWRGGINPVPASPIKFFFPNTWENCGGTSPWSCANTSGEIWLIAAHGVRAEVVNHEMGHQLNNKYWNNKRPAGSGGSHSLDGCYPTRLGMALREGFADFIPGWVGYPARNATAGGFSTGRWALDFDLESNVSPPNCPNGWENELWVARTFWDLHDTHTDGDDILWYVHPGAVPALYLGNGIANDGDPKDMRDYEAVYRANCTPGHEGFITDIFNQNRH